MNKRLIAAFAAAILSAGLVGSAAYADHGEYCNDEAPAAEQPLDELGLGNIGVATVLPVDGDGDAVFVGVYDEDSGISAEAFTNEGGVTVRADTGQGVSYCSDGTRDGVTDLLP